MMGAILYNMDMLYVSTPRINGHCTAVSWEGGFFTSAGFDEVH